MFIWNAIEWTIETKDDRNKVTVDIPSDRVQKDVEGADVSELNVSRS